MGVVAYGFSDLVDGERGVCCSMEDIEESRPEVLWSSEVCLGQGGELVPSKVGELGLKWL